MRDLISGLITYCDLKWGKISVYDKNLKKLKKMD